MIGEGEYNLDDFRQVDVTESYLSLDPSIKRCQNEEPLHNCTTRQHIDTIIRQCGCLPINLRTSDEVFFLSYELLVTRKLASYIHLFVQEPVCASNKIKCIRNIKVVTSSCLKPCSGITVNSLFKSEQTKNLEKLFPLYQAYNRYKKVTPYPQGYDGKNF